MYWQSDQGNSTVKLKEALKKEEEVNEKHEIKHKIGVKYSIPQNNVSFFIFPEA